MLSPSSPNLIKIKNLGQQEYAPVWQQMKLFTHNRTAATTDEIWLLEHDPVYTQGQAGKAEHLLNPGDIPVLQSDRGGQVTYHGPGQLIVYLLTDIQRKKINVREFICLLEQAVLELLAIYNIQGELNPAAPGVYVNQAKICSLGLRVRHGCTYHGLSLNVAMDLEPFSRINPCGYVGMQVTQIKDFKATVMLAMVKKQLLDILVSKIGYEAASQ